jgi:hypothetical protein
MDWQLEIQFRGVDVDAAEEIATEFAAKVKALVDGDEGRYCVALIPRPSEVVTTKDAA